MKKTAWGTTALLAMCAISAFTDGPPQRAVVHAPGLNPRIGPANPQQYNSIRDAKDWKNPYLVIRPDGVEVIANGVQSGRQIVSAGVLQRTLINLPVRAWPYGRVVAVQDTSLLSYPADLQPRATNREAALAILKTLQVVVSRWPA